MKKRRIRNLIETILLVVIVAVGLATLSQILMRKDTWLEYKQFYEEADDIDVMFYGASVIHCSVYPMQLWEDYGITSYNMANDSERLGMTYYTLLNSLDYASPKAVVIDLTGMCWAGQTRDNTLKDHNFMDVLPLSKNKIKTAQALFNGEGELLEYLFPFSLYHSRWDELTETDFEKDYYDVKHGAKFYTTVMPMVQPTEEDYDLSATFQMEYEDGNIRNMIALCEERGITPIFTYIMFSCRGGDQKLREHCANLLAEEGYPLYDMSQVDIVDWDRDFADDPHLNYYGGVKYTDYLGQILRDEYDIPDHRGEQPLTDTWNADLKIYHWVVENHIDNTIGVYLNNYQALTIGAIRVSEDKGRCECDAGADATISLHAVCDETVYYVNDGHCRIDYHLCDAAGNAICDGSLDAETCNAFYNGKTINFPVQGMTEPGEYRLSATLVCEDPDNGIYEEENLAEVAVEAK